MSLVPDVARVRYDNAMRLFDEFVQATVSAPDAATLRGLERRFAERLQIQPSYWSQIKSRSRQIGERLARQFETLCRKPHGWMDAPHSAGTDAVASIAATDAGHGEPQADDERFLVGLVLNYYRRHPQRARTRLLDLLGEVLVPPAIDPPPARHPPATQAKPASGATERPADDQDLWLRTQNGVAPLKKKR